MLIAEDYFSDEETQKLVQEMSKALTSALKVMLECPSTNDRTNRHTTQ